MLEQDEAISRYVRRNYIPIALSTRLEVLDKSRTEERNARLCVPRTTTGSEWVVKCTVKGSQFLKFIKRIGKDSCATRGDEK